MALNAVPLLCVLLGLKVPWFFESPNRFTFMTLVILGTSQYLVKRLVDDSRRPLVQLLLTGYWLALLLVFPKAFHFNLTGFSSTFFESVAYRIVVPPLTCYLVHQALNVFLDEWPVWLEGITMLASAALILWFVFDQGLGLPLGLYVIKGAALLLLATLLAAVLRE